MIPQHDIAKQLLEKHFYLWNLQDKLLNAGVNIDALLNINIVDSVLDVFGFPPECSTYSREQACDMIFEFKGKDLTALIKRLNTELNTVLLQHPELFVITSYDLEE